MGRGRQCGLEARSGVGKRSHREEGAKHENVGTSNL